MLNLIHFTEQEFQDFMKAGFGDISRLNPAQINEMRRAFYGGLAVACFNDDKIKEIRNECNHFFKQEIKQHIKALKDEN